MQYLFRIYIFICRFYGKNIPLKYGQITFKNKGKGKINIDIGFEGGMDKGVVATSMLSHASREDKQKYRRGDENEAG